jgi:hypothetical protein
VLKALLKKLLHVVLTLLVFIYIIFEELVWESIAKPIYDYIHALKILQKVELYINKLNPSLLLVIFILMFVQVELLGIGAAIMLAKGKAYTAIAMYATKIPIGAFTFWLFRVSKDKLMTFGWFKTSYNYVMGLIDKIKDSDIYKDIKIKANNLKTYIKNLKLKYFPNKSSLKEKINKIYITIKVLFK